MRGLFITLEGGDGSGKSTQIRNIEKFFTEKGRVVLHTREPGGPRISEKLREILLDTGNTEMEAVTEMFIYAAARAQHVRETVIPALERGEIVICDRFVDSSIAYQAYGRCLGDMVAEVNRHMLTMAITTKLAATSVQRTPNIPAPGITTVTPMMTKAMLTIRNGTIARRWTALVSRVG